MKRLLFAAFVGLSMVSFAQEKLKTKTVGNPVFPGWYADPEGIIFGETYWIYPTFSDEYGEPDPADSFTELQLKARKNTINPQYLQQTFFDAFSSKDLVNWEKHPHVLDIKNVSWAAYAIWAPSIIRNKKYYLMWSEGGWTGPDYSVAYAVGDSPFGPFKRIGKILQQDPKIATGAGHHSVINIPGTDDWYIVYHRRPLGDTNGHHRETCIDRMYFDKDGFIQPVKITKEGVGKRTLK